MFGSNVPVDDELGLEMTSMLILLIVSRAAVVRSSSDESITGKSSMSNSLGSSSALSWSDEEDDEELFKGVVTLVAAGFPITKLTSRCTAAELGSTV